MEFIYKKIIFIKDFGKIIKNYMEFKLINLVIIKENLKIIKKKARVNLNGRINNIIMAIG